MSETTGIVIKNVLDSEIITPSVGKTTFGFNGDGTAVTKNSDGIVTAIGGSGDVLTVKRTLTPSEIRAIHTTPIELLAAQGANKAIIPMSRYVEMLRIDEDYTGQQNILCGYEDDYENYDLFDNYVNVRVDLTSYPTGKKTFVDYPAGNNFTPDARNLPIILMAFSEITNEAANGTATIVMTYTVVDLS
jgi:hypothetical protein